MRVLYVFFIFTFIFKAHAFNEDVVVLPLNDWPSQRLLSKIVGDKIAQLGYKVEYLPISSSDQMGAMRKGFVHLQVETWQTYDDGEFSKAIKNGYIEDLGLHTAFGREDWWYPDYVADLCPGLPSWQALKACSKIFSEGRQNNKGIFYTGPWNYRDAALIRALELDFTIARLSNAEQLLQKLLQAKKLKKPIVMLHWSPDWIDLHMKGHFIEFPEFEKACEKDPAWGINPNMLYDCGNPKKTYIKKSAWPGVKDKWPCVYSLMKKVNFTSEMISMASALYGVEKKSEQQAKALWLAKYEEQSRAWIDFSCPKAQ